MRATHSQTSTGNPRHRSPITRMSSTCVQPNMRFHYPHSTSAVPLGHIDEHTVSHSRSSPTSCLQQQPSRWGKLSLLSEGILVVPHPKTCTFFIEHDMVVRAQSLTLFRLRNKYFHKKAECLVQSTHKSLSTMCLKSNQG